MWDIKEVRCYTAVHFIDELGPRTLEPLFSGAMCLAFTGAGDELQGNHLLERFAGRAARRDPCQAKRRMGHAERHGALIKVGGDCLGDDLCGVQQSDVAHAVEEARAG